MMKKLLTLFILVSPLIMQAQKSAGLTLRATPKGIFIAFSVPEAAGNSLELQRKAPGEPAFKTIARINPPQELSEVREKIREAAEVFSPAARPSDENLEKVWADYKSNSRQTVGFVAAVPQLAYIFSLAWLDKDTQAGRKYQYRVVSGTARYESEEFLYSAPPYFPRLTLLGAEKYEAVIAMKVNFPEGRNPMFRVDVMRKNVTQKPDQYKVVHPFINLPEGDVMEIVDTTLQTYGAYDYRVQLSDVFGAKDTAVYYFEGNNLPKELVPEVSEVKISSLPDARSLQVNWNVSAAERVQSVTLYRSREYEGPYRIAGVFNGGERSFTDRIDQAGELYFYSFEVKDIFGYSTRSIRYHAVFEGNSVPTPPIDVTLTETAEGPRLSWSATDRITRGFYVFRKKGLDGDFEQVSPIILINDDKGTFLDSARLSPEFNYFYTVRSESDTYTQSVFSDTLFYQPVLTPQSVYLKPPHDIHISYSGKVARLTWENVHEEAAEVLGYQVYRKSESDKEFKLLTGNPLPFVQNVFSDSVFNGALRLSYMIVSIDGKGNSGAGSLPVSLDLSGTYVLVPDETGFVADAKGITLKWTGISREQVKSIKIYRAEDDGNIQVVSTLGNTITQYRDVAVRKGKSYTYQVATIDIRGKESRADPLVVNF